ncbi:SelT/SelW/SelH family protein [Craterilacuibacter sp.]|uniref:SelT/SelW/SelH family protein n=1 Tax=Craterilacuibacter sp. TaxID=2870909 RepID=UPI003F2F902F
MMNPAPALPRLAIHYCTGCRWLMRAAWMAQELLTTFEKELGEVALVPGHGGVFRILCDDELLWDRKIDGGFPDIKALKQRVRDRIAPGKALGHSETAAH